MTCCVSINLFLSGWNSFQAGILPLPCIYWTCFIPTQQNISWKENVTWNKYFLKLFFIVLFLLPSLQISICLGSRDSSIWLFIHFPREWFINCWKRSCFILQNAYQILWQAVLIKSHSQHLGRFYRQAIPWGSLTHLFFSISL